MTSSYAVSFAYFFLLLPKENTFVSNTSSFDYEILPLPRHGRKTLVFQVSAAAELRVALMEEDPREDGDGTGPSYHIVLGGEDNMNTWISKHMNGRSYRLFNCLTKYNDLTMSEMIKD